MQNVNFYNVETVFSPWSESRFIWTVMLCPIKSKVSLPLKSELQSNFRFKTLSLPQISMVVAHCYNLWTLNSSSLHMHGLEKSSAYTQPLKGAFYDLQFNLQTLRSWYQRKCHLFSCETPRKLIVFKLFGCPRLKK